jgi:hypothetical protein
MGFSVFVEILNLRLRRTKKQVEPVKLHESFIAESSSDGSTGAD